MMGQSAGAYSVCFHIASKYSQRYFSRAIIMSAMCDMANEPIEKRNQQGRRYYCHHHYNIAIHTYRITLYCNLMCIIHTTYIY